MIQSLPKAIKGVVIQNKSKSVNYFTTFFQNLGDMWSFAMRFFREVFNLPFEFNEFISQAFQVGNRSIGLVGITGFIMGLVLTLQSKPTLADFGAESWLPGMVAVSLIREIGPVITALICAGKVGSGIGAELGSMRVSEQIDAMEVSGANPYKYLVVTRILATTIMVPILVLYSDAIGLVGSFVGVNIGGDVSFTLFMSRATGILDFSDLIPATIKSIFFGFVIGVVGCYKGYNADRGTESVGRAANEAVVSASLMVFIVDVMAVQLTNLLVL